MTPSEQTILRLMEVFDRPDCSFRGLKTNEQAEAWKPVNEPEQRAFESLIAPENREALKAWYSASTSLNPRAALFRHFLELSIGEKLPVPP